MLRRTKSMLVRADLLGALLGIAYVCCPQTGASAQRTARRRTGCDCI